MGQALLQSGTALMYVLQSRASGIPSGIRLGIMGHFLWHSGAAITKWGYFCYKVGKILQSGAIIVQKSKEKNTRGQWILAVNSWIQSWFICLLTDNLPLGIPE